MSGVIRSIADLMAGDAVPDIRDLGEIASVANQEFGAPNPDKAAALWREAIAAIPFEAASFVPLYQSPRADFEHRLAAWCDRILDSPDIVEDDFAYGDIFGYLAVLLLTVSTLEHADRRRMDDVAQPSASADRAGLTEGSDGRQDLVQRLLLNDAVGRALLRLYHPIVTDDERSAAVAADDTAPNTEARLGSNAIAAEQFWRDLEPRDLRFHRFGTTSFILKTVASSSAGPADDGRFAIKCVLLPYASLPVIAESSRTYSLDYQRARESDFAVTIRHSTTSWIAMDFVAGETLEEFIRRHDRTLPMRNDQAVYARRELMLQVGPLLFDVLAGLRQHELVHGDLNPSNLIINEVPDRQDRPYHLTVIDFGRNYLYGQSGLGRQASDARYVAPEVRTDDRMSSFADLYSLGQLLIGLSGVGREGDNAVPDAFYRRNYYLARFLEDLIAADRDERLLFVENSHSLAESDNEADDRPIPPSVYEELREVYLTELNSVLEADRNDGLFGPPGRIRRFILLFGPISGTPGRAWRLYRFLLQQMRGTENKLPESIKAEFGRRIGLARRALFRSVVCAAAWLAGLTLIGYLTLCDLGVLSAAPVDGLTGSIRASDYSLPPAHLRENLPARIAFLSLAWAAAKYYENIFSGLTTRIAPILPSRLRKAAAACEFFVRINTFFCLLVLVPVNLLGPSWWTTATAITLINSLGVNWTALVFVSAVLSSARRPDPVAGRPALSTLPARIVGLDMFRPWTPSMIAYVVIVIGFALLINYHVLQDSIAYAAVVAVVNVGLLTFTKCGTLAEPVRIGLTRVYLAAERLGRMEVGPGRRPEPERLIEGSAAQQS